MRCSDCGNLLTLAGLPGDDGPVCGRWFADYDPPCRPAAQELSGGVLLALAAYCVGVMLFVF